MNADIDNILPEIMLKIFHCHGISHGSKSDSSRGMHDGNEGVQWNIDIINSNNLIRTGVNLEGLKYKDWPIARFFEKELKTLALYTTISKMNDHEIVVTLLRDAWQVRARPPIEERIIGGKEVSIQQITVSRWENLIREAQICLDPKKSFRGRALQEVTFLNGTKRFMEVSPHLYMYKVVPKEKMITKNDIIQAFFKCKRDLEPLYEALKQELADL